MRAMIAAIVLASAPWVTWPVLASQPAVTKRGPVAEAARLSSSDAWRYKFHQGRWWYWISANRWAVYNNGNWLMSPKQAPTAKAQVPSLGKPIAATQDKESGSFEEDYPALPVESEPGNHPAEHYLSVGNVYSQHAHEHAEVLQRYAASDDTVPANIVREQAKAIRHDVEQAQKSFARAAAADEESKNESRTDAIKELQAELQKVTESVRRLESVVQRQGEVQARLVRGQTAVVSRLLQQANEAARAAELEERRQEQDEKDRVGID